MKEDYTIEVPNERKELQIQLHREKEADIDAHQSTEQAELRSSYSTTDHIQVVDQVIEKYLEFNRPLYEAFIDYKKAFELSSHESIWEALKSLDIKEKYINILKNIYSNSTNHPKTHGKEQPGLKTLNQGKECGYSKKMEVGKPHGQVQRQKVDSEICRMVCTVKRRSRGRPLARWTDEIAAVAGRNWLNTAKDKKK
ncbi:hypothetical protein EVAR_29749_1 [Eumeta japonica]|uniref:Reverse transcriptase domain-containing protein n=1 Tax=Eumeta variegata TaxID=151549 RepID=A0A4C1WXS1_EUMVA|nr:hypothetical protein EVAR_29749_1 [Eumeta japonica]